MKKEGKSASGEQAVLTAYRIMAGIALRKAIKRREVKNNEPELHSRFAEEAGDAFPIGRRD